MKDRQIRRSRTRSPDRNRRQNKRPRRIEHEDRRGVGEYDRNDLRRNDDRISKQTQSQQSVRRDREDDEMKQKDMSPNATLPESVPAPAEKTVKEIEIPVSKESPEPEPENKLLEPALAPMEVEKEASSEDEDDDDGIDLFASEESESENEGRFKSSTSKNERTAQVPTLSFTKLGESRPVEVKELTDIDSNSNRDRDRDRDRDRRNNYGRSRGMGGDHFRGTDRIGRDRDRRNKNDLGNNNKSRRDRDRERGRDRDWDSPLSKVVEEKKSSSGADRPMFKSTFQALENEGLWNDWRWSWSV